MRNMMKEYLGDDYSENYVRNFCLYWIKASKGSGSIWRKKNDLDCLYYNGDLLADTLISAWTPIKFVADLLNKDTGKVFFKRRKDCDDPLHDLRLLADDTDAYLPPKNKLVIKLKKLLKLAELKCNYFLLPNRRMNNARYCMEVNFEKLMLYDQVPAMVWHVFEQETLGRYFLDEDGFIDEDAAASWIRRENLQMCFRNEVVKQSEVLPLVEGLEPCDAKWLTDEKEIDEALTYMINLLTERNKTSGDEEV